MMNRPATIDTRPTGSAPRRFTPVATQITTSMIAYFAGPARSGKEVPEVLDEQHRVDRHVDERIQPRQPAVLERPEVAERALHPAIVAALLGQHARQLADDEHFGNRPEDRHREQHEQREPGPDVVHERLGGVRATGRREVENEDEREGAERAF